jgi:branched-chain amino acid transport system substrate-binding protein
MTTPPLKSILLGATAALGILTTYAAHAQDKTPIVFVTAIIESGPFKVTDVQNLAGVQFAVKQINASGGINGHPVQLDVIDTELNAAATQRKVTDEILNNNAKVIIGASGSDIVNALVSVGQKYHVPVVAFAGEADDMTGARFQPALFRVASNTSMHASAIVFAMK